MFKNAQVIEPNCLLHTLVGSTVKRQMTQNEIDLQQLLEVKGCAITQKLPK